MKFSEQIFNVCRFSYPLSLASLYGRSRPCRKHQSHAWILDSGCHGFRAGKQLAASCLH